MHIKKTMTTAILAAFIFSAAPNGAAAAKDLSQWLKTTGAKLTSTQKRNKTDGAATAGTKGAEEKATDELYWKDSTSNIREEEIKSLDAAIELIKAGKKSEAINALKDFIKTFPKSPLKDDAVEGLKILKSQQ